MASKLQKAGEVYDKTKGKIGGYWDEGKAWAGEFLSDMGAKAEDWSGEFFGEMASDKYSDAIKARKSYDITAKEFLKEKRRAMDMADAVEKYNPLVNVGAQSGIIGAGMGAVTGMFSDDQSVIGGAMTGAVAGFGLGAAAGGLKASKLAAAEENIVKLESNLAKSGARKRTLRAQVRAGEKNLEAGYDRLSDGARNRITEKYTTAANELKQVKKEQARNIKELKSNKSVRARAQGGVNPWVTGGLAAAGSLAYATLDSNRV